MARPAFEKIEELAKLLHVQPEFVKAAALPADRGDALLRKARLGKKIENYIGLPAGIVLISCMFASPFTHSKHEDIPTPMKFALYASGLAYMGSRIADRRHSLKASVQDSITTRAIALDRQP